MVKIKIQLFNPFNFHWCPKPIKSPESPPSEDPGTLFPDIQVLWVPCPDGPSQRNLQNLLASFCPGYSGAICCFPCMDGGTAHLPLSFLFLHLDTRVSVSCIVQSPLSYACVPFSRRAQTMFAVENQRQRSNSSLSSPCPPASSFIYPI